jgi:hypothetical protein
LAEGNSGAAIRSGCVATATLLARFASAIAAVLSTATRITPTPGTAGAVIGTVTVRVP